MVGGGCCGSECWVFFLGGVVVFVWMGFVWVCFVFVIVVMLVGFWNFWGIGELGMEGELGVIGGRDEEVLN